MNIKQFVLLLFILGTAAGTSSCHKWSVRHKQKRDMRERERQQREKEKEAEEAYQEAVKAHASHQSKRTKKEMKRNYKKAERYNYHKKEFFLKRWFKGKKKRKHVSPETS